MGFFTAIGDKIKSTAQFLGNKAQQASQFLGEKVQKALPQIGAIGQTVSDIANKVSPYMPIGGTLVKSIGDVGQWVADNVKSGRVNNTLEKAKTGLNDFSKATNAFK
jgi:hypothetical protein